MARGMATRHVSSLGAAQFQAIHPSSAIARPPQVFDRIDADRDGHINSEELRAAFLLARPEGVGDSMIGAMMRWTDRNHDGLVSFDEYARVLRITAT